MRPIAPRTIRSNVSQRLVHDWLDVPLVVCERVNHNLVLLRILQSFDRAADGPPRGWTLSGWGPDCFITAQPKPKTPAVRTRNTTSRAQTGAGRNKAKVIVPRIRHISESTPRWLLAAASITSGLRRASNVSPISKRPNRDRGEFHNSSPPTPPCVRVTYTAVRLIQSMSLETLTGVSPFRFPVMVSSSDFAGDSFACLPDAIPSLVSE